MRPDSGLVAGHEWHIWKVEQEGDTWGEPKQIIFPSAENMSQSHSSITNDGSIYFHLNPDKGYREMDLYYSTNKNGIYSPPIRIAETDSKEHKEITPYISPDESFLIFASYSREDGFGDGDLYIRKKR